MTTVAELQQYLDALRVVGPYPEPTVDTVKAGDPNTRIRGIAVGWMAYTWALRAALDLGCNVFVTHEPTYFDHHDHDPLIETLPGVRDKRAFIEASGIVVLRCHDVWDQYPGTGIGDSWGEWLGLGDAIDGDRFLRVYEVAPRTAHQLATEVAARLAPLGQSSVNLAGPGETVVTRVGIGTGAISPFPDMLARFDVDVAITTDDGTHYWRDAGLAIDLGRPLIVVHHAVSEEPGVASLADHLANALPDVPVHHVRQGCMYRVVTSDEWDPAQEGRREN